MKKGSEISRETIRLALWGASIRNAHFIYDDNYDIPSECIEAALTIQENSDQFKRQVWQQTMPLTRQFFGRLLRTRLRQRGYLACPIVSEIFDDEHPVERRLELIQGVKGLVNLRMEYGGSQAYESGLSTDNTIVDMVLPRFFGHLDKIREST